MNRDSIIAQLYTGKNFTDVIAKMDPPHLREDLKQEVIMIVCGWDADKIIKLHSEGVLDFYVARVIINQIQSSTSPFYKMYRQPFYELDSNRPGRAVFENGEVNGEMMNAAFKDKVIKREGHHLCTDGIDEDTADRMTKEGLEDVAMAIVEDWCNSKDNSLHYRGNLIKLYMKLCNYRAIQKETGIPFISCFKNIKQSIEMLREMVLNKPVFSKDELRQIQNETPKLKLDL